MTVEDMLSAPAEFDHELTVRSIAPAVVLVLEREAPMRAECLSSTSAEFDALRDWVASSPPANAVLGAYFAAKEAEEGIDHTDLWLREEQHAERLDNASRIASDRAVEVTR